VNSRAVTAQSRLELALTLRRGESLLLSLGIPVILLGFLSLADVLPLPEWAEEPVDFLAPGILALAVMSTSFVGLSIATGFERQYAVLKRLGATPLGRGGLLVAKTAAMLVVLALQFAVLVGLAYALGWRPEAAGWPAAVAASLLAAVGFAGLGLLLAGTLKGEVVLAAANGLWVVFLLLGDVVFPLEQLPGWLESVCRLLPTAALADLLRGALSVGVDARLLSWAVLALWALVTPVLAARWFRWV
jgi:ABC-2 type transport system permease protein